MGDLGLKKWVNKQRNLYSKQNKTAGEHLNQEQIDLLDNMNFVWDVYEFSWNTRMDELKQFILKHGHYHVPKDYEYFPKLERWMNNLRSQREKNILSKKQIEDLDQFNFDWNRLETKSETLEARWLEKFQQLQEFYNKHGHSRVTKSNCNDESLIKFTQRQRTHCKKESRRKMLDSVEYSWSITHKYKPQQEWLEMFNKLKEYKEIHGHTRVTRYNLKSDTSLAYWVARQRKKQRHNCLIEERVKLLDSIEFDWTPPTNVSLSF